MPCVVIEQVAELKPLGVGINLQPNAVRELMDLGFTAKDMNTFGVEAREWALVGRQGQEIYAELRGTDAGYHWPQYAAHRGQFHMALYQRFREFAGDASIRLGARATAYHTLDDGRVKVALDTGNGSDEVTGRLLIGCLLYTSPSPRDMSASRMPSSA